MDFNEFGLQVQNFFSNTSESFWEIFFIVFLAGVILFFPVIIASLRGLSGIQILGVFLATIFGFWILGLILALVLPQSN